MFYIYWVITALLAGLLLRNVFASRSPIIQVSYGLMLVPFLLRILVLK